MCSLVRQLAATAATAQRTASLPILALPAAVKGQVVVKVVYFKTNDGALQVQPAAEEGTDCFGSNVCRFDVALGRLLSCLAMLFRLSCILRLTPV